MSIKIKKAIKVLTKALETDEDYFYGWQANIAMAFQDEYYREKEKGKGYFNKTDVHRISNNAATNFLNSLINSRRST